jgi:hypothetical protein
MRGFSGLAGRPFRCRRQPVVIQSVALGQADTYYRAMRRIFFDANSRDPDGRYILNPGETEPWADALHDGLLVVLYTPNELELEAVLKFDHEWSFWTASYVVGTLRHLDEERPH